MCTFRRSEWETWVSLVMNIRRIVGWITNRPMNIVASRKEVPFVASRNKVRHILPPVATPSLFHNDSIRRKRIHRSAFDRENINHTKSLFFLFFAISDLECDKHRRYITNDSCFFFSFKRIINNRINIIGETSRPLLPFFFIILLSASRNISNRF